MDDKKLVETLKERGVITEDESKRILRGTGASGKSAERIIYEQRLAPEDEVVKVKSEVLGVPFKKEVDPDSIPEDLMDTISYKTSRTYKVIPLAKKDNMLVVGMLDPEDQRAKDALKFVAKQNKLSLGVYLVTMSDLRAVWNRYMPYENELDAALKEIGQAEEDEQDVVGLEEGLHSSEEAPIIKIVASTLRRAVDEGASDIHIEPQRERLRVRFRIDGDLYERSTLPVRLSKPIVSRVKVMSQLRLDETRIPQDGRFRTIIFGRDIDFRVATLPTPSGEKIVLRVLDPSKGMKSIEELGLNEYNFKLLSDAIDSPYGMLLFTGPTGSGKTTSLYAILNRVSTEEVNVVSLEDPVEYFINSVNQSQVMPGIGYDFASGLRQILRQDPDVVMVGEIRDSETAGLAVNAALTGHLLLSTLHTNNAVGVIPRLTDLGVPSFLLPSALNLMVAQRLIAQLCTECATPQDPPEHVENIIKKELENISGKMGEKIRSEFSKPYKIYKTGEDDKCSACNGQGLVGRTAIFEMFKMTKRLGNIINEGFSESKIWEESEKQGMVTLRQDGIIKALRGEVLMEEVLRETSGQK